MPLDTTQYSSDDEECITQIIKEYNNKVVGAGKPLQEDYEPHYYQRSFNGDGLGIQSSMKAFAGKKKYSGSWEENFNITISVYATLVAMCKVSETKTLKAILVMLSGDALLYFSSNVENSSSYEKATSTL